MKVSIFNYNKPLHYEPLKVYSNVTDSSFWKNKDQSHGFSSNILIQSSNNVCNGFFVLWYTL